MNLERNSRLGSALLSRFDLSEWYMSFVISMKKELVANLSCCLIPRSLCYA